MNLSGAIYTANEMRPNTLSERIKREWIEELDRLIWREVICTHEGDVGEMPTYTNADDGKELLAPDPYASLYPQYIVMKIDEAMGEYMKYNNSRAIFGEAYNNFTWWYNREHMPLGVKKVTF